MSDNKVTLDQLDDSAVEAMSSSVGDVSMLNTENKTIVGAITEIVGKKEIANAIGEPLAETDKFTEMSSEINGLLSTFKTNMMNAGVVVESGDKFKALIDKIKGLTEGEGNKGVQFASGVTTDFIQKEHAYTKVSSEGESSEEIFSAYDIELTFDFNPSLIYVYSKYDHTTLGMGTDCESVTIFDALEMQEMHLAYKLSMEVDIQKLPHLIENNIYYLPITSKSDSLVESLTIYESYWYAIGVGEEDTTLRDSLADILENKGVDVTEEDDMASLITKVDDMNTINTDKSQLLCYKVDEITYNLDSSNYGNDYFNVFVKDDFAYFIVQDKGMQTYGTISCNCKFIKYNIKTGEVVLEKIQYDNQTYNWRIADAYMGYDDIVIVGEFGIHSISLDDFTATQIFRDAYRISTNAKSFRIGDILYCGLDGQNYDYSSVVIAYNIKTKTVVNTIYTPRLVAGNDYDEFLYFLCPDLINEKIYFIGGDYGYPFYQTDLSLNVINMVHLNNSTSNTKFNSRFAFANDTKLSVITQDLNSRYPNVCEINIADPLSECTNRSLNCECFLDGYIDLSSFTVYTHLEAPCVAYYGQYAFIKHKDSFVRINTLNGTAVNISIPLYFKIFRVIDENTIECITRTGIYTFKIEEI